MTKSATVPRELYEAVRQERDFLRRTIAAWMKPVVAAADAAYTPAVPPRTPSIVAQAIKEQSGGDPRLAAHYHKRASQLRREGKSPADIAAELSKWSTTEQEQ